ncbi:hypothetical protein [Agrococcus terreus]|uniref:Uncharacterized protein n=1 Tax=Agrococcus terreus TaxID=574649 RepID=A0ABQ2KIJ3_9MICO|nr:hypothetical protein [Agrococcus terreus]GGN84397.1 hypothetical protein GCM10010968_16080 [Agrococcus terreus]
MDADRIPHRTLLLGGALLAIAGSVALLHASAPALDAPVWLQPALAGALVPAVAALLLFAGMAVLGIGIGAERGIAGRRLPAIALVVASGAAWLVPNLLSVLPPEGPLPLPVGTLVPLVLLGLALAAAVAVLAAGRVPGPARWALVLVALCQAVAALASIGPTEELAMLGLRLAPLWPASIAVAGVMLLAAGRIRMPQRRVPERRAA